MIQSFGAELIRKERAEQISKHGYTVEQDAVNNANQDLIFAADAIMHRYGDGWPAHWDKETYNHIMEKPRSEQLAIAGAFIAAQIDVDEYLTIKTSSNGSSTSH
jgi:hypothetical protein